MSWLIRYRDSAGHEWELPEIPSEHGAMLQTRLLARQPQKCKIVEVRNNAGFVIAGEKLPRQWTEYPTYLDLPRPARP